ncbi:hypothetical protein ACFE04_006278 [Oxalis oulophora]
MSRLDERAGAEVVYGPEECSRRSAELLEELGFPIGVMPLKDLEECGRNKETGFVWMKQKAPYQHFFESTNTRVSYASEVTAYVEKGKMKNMSGVKSKQLFMWVPIVEMSLEEGVVNGKKKKRIWFSTPLGIKKPYSVTAFMTEIEKDKYLQQQEEDVVVTTN